MKRVTLRSIRLAFGPLGMKEWILKIVPVKPIIVSIPSLPANQRPAGCIVHASDLVVGLHVVEMFRLPWAGPQSYK